MATRFAPRRSAASSSASAFFLGAEANGLGAPPAARQHRQRLDSGFGAAELVDDGAEGGRSDILASDQPEPAQALARGQSRGVSRLARSLRACSRQSASPSLLPAARYSR